MAHLFEMRRGMRCPERLQRANCGIRAITDTGKETENEIIRRIEKSA